jgi:hypothetical protein
MAGGMLLYAVPRLAVGEGLGAGPVFGTVWLCFALLIIAAQLHELLGVDAKKRERLRQVKRMKTFRLQRKTDNLARRYGKGA